VVGLLHINRRDSSDVLMRISGSGGWGAAARSVLVVGEDPEDPGASLLAQAKLNVGRPRPSLRFRFEGRTVDTPDGPTETVGLVWSGESERRADELLADRGTPEERGALADAKDCLSDLLADGPVESAVCKKRVAEAGLAWRTVERAKADLRVRSVPGKGEERRKRFWTLPAVTPPTAPLCGGIGGLGGARETRVSSVIPPSKSVSPPRGIDIENPSSDGGLDSAPPAAKDALPTFARRVQEVFETAVITDRDVPNA
jgi:hypothetical protein